MRSIKLLAVTCTIASGISSCYESSEKINVPIEIVNSLNESFPKAKKVSWEMENENEFEAEFFIDDHIASAKFALGGKLLEFETEINADSAPDIVKARLANDFQKYKVEKLEKVVREEELTLYEVELISDDKQIEIEISSIGEVLKRNSPETDDMN